MKTYPTGVLQNFAAPFTPPVLRPVGEQNWRMFAPSVDATTALKMIEAIAPGAQMLDANEGQYSQFVYADENPDIRVRIVYGKVGALNIEEFPSDIFDRFTYPQPFIDEFPRPNAPVLKCRAVTPDIGELYWSS